MTGTSSCWTCGVSCSRACVCTIVVLCGGMDGGGNFVCVLPCCCLQHRKTPHSHSFFSFLFSPSPSPGLTNNEYGVLTTYVPNFDQLHLNLNGRFEVPQICKVLYTEPEKMVRNEQATNCIWLSKPKLTSSWAAGFSFNKCHADLKTPYDPHLPSLFDGEEYSKYARMWTRYVAFPSMAIF